MKQRLMALTIDFEKAFNTVVLISNYAGIKGLTPIQQNAYVGRYISIIQLLGWKNALVNLINFQPLMDQIHAMENYFNDICEADNAAYCPWAENTSASIDGEWTLGVINFHLDQQH